MTKSGGASHSAAKIAKRIKALGREIGRHYGKRRVDVVVMMDRGFMFAADLVRELPGPVVLHFLNEDVHDVELGGLARREVYFSNRGAVTGGKDRPVLKGRDVLLVDAVIDSGVTQDFLLRRLGESKPRSLRLAVLLDKTSRRRVGLEPDYFGFRTASNVLWSGFGLSNPDGTGRNGRNLLPGGSRAAGKRGGKKR